MAHSRRPLVQILEAVMNAQEQERTRVARLLHDDVGQVLSAVGLQLDVLRMDIDAEAPEIARRISESQKLLERAVDSVRALSYELNPAIVERAGLQVALDRLVGRYRDLSSVSIRMLFDSSVRLPVKAAASLYKIAESALDNAVKHSQGNQVEVFVKPSRNSVLLEVNDNGAGFDPGEVRRNPPGLGLLLMQCHAERAGLKLSINSTPGQGTIVRARYSTSAESS